MPTFASSLVNHIRAALWLLDWPVNAEQVEAAGHPFSASVDKQLESSTFVSSTTKLVYGLASDNCAHASSSSLLSTSSTLSSLTALESPDTIQNVLSRDYEIDGRTGFVPSSAAVTSAPAELDTRDEDIDGKKKNRNRLPAAYDRWEDALASAPDQLALADADDDSMRARRFRVSGHEWRTQFHQASILLVPFPPFDRFHFAPLLTFLFLAIPAT
ncbi:SubName: Full=Related to BNA2-tryptophan 2,3-dioxygenase {ECO:0000313/EMBL:CCA73498.1} [Serendipita indica DSM 11827]|nr:SubName: Full=Related to BNA2-tryptophan 2,3-dioxygenase {ECO:0000313/EMBL:CCA73498.1} [Serendipita indica DSM 11827]